MELKVKLKSSTRPGGQNDYNHSINADDYKQVALIFLDLKNHNVPIEKAFQEFKRLTTSDFDMIIGT